MSSCIGISRFGILPWISNGILDLPTWFPNYYYFSLFLRLNAHFPAKAGLAGFIAPEDHRSRGDNWNCKTCKSPVKSSPQLTNTQCFILGNLLVVIPPKCLVFPNDRPILSQGNTLDDHLFQLPDCEFSLIKLKTSYSITKCTIIDSRLNGIRTFQ